MRFLLASLLVFSVGTAPQAFAQASRVPGSRVSLDPPAGFHPAERFPGFQHDAGSASLMVMEMPAAAMAEIRLGMTREALATGGMTLLDSSAVRVNGTGALLLSVSQEARGVAFRKRILIAGDSVGTVMVTATYPTAAAATFDEPLELALRSVTWTPSPPTDAFEGLPFRIGESPRLRTTRGMGHTLSLTEDERERPAADGAVHFLVAAGTEPLDESRMALHSLLRARRTATLTGVGGFDGKAIEVNGRPAYELTAEAMQGETSVRLYQVVVTDDVGYFVLVGIVAADRAAEWLPEFRRLARTFRVGTAPPD